MTWVFIQADAEMFEGIMLNLAGNAMKFTPAGGAVTVKLAVTDEAALIEVSDTGAGIPAESLPLLFERFQQLENGVQRRYGGTGLGLALVRKFAKAQGASVGVESLNLEGAEYDHAYVKVSNDGANWTTVWQNAQDITDNQWSLVELDISAIADGQPTVYLRWTMGATDGGLVGSGWNLDDIEISGFQSQGCSDGDVDGDGDPTPPCGGGDCNGQDPTVHSGGQEFCDGLDNDCDGEVDEACNGENPTGGPGPGDAEQELSNGDLRGTYCGLGHDADGRALAWSWLLLCSALMLRKRRS